MALRQCCFLFFLFLLLPESSVHRVKHSKTNNQANTQFTSLRGATKDPNSAAPPSVKVAAFSWPSASDLRGKVRSGSTIAWLVQYILTTHVKVAGVVIAHLQNVDKQFCEKVEEWAEASGYKFHEIITDSEAPTRDILLVQGEKPNKKKMFSFAGEGWLSCQIRRHPEAAGALNVLAGHGFSAQLTLKHHQVDIFLADEKRLGYWKHDGVLLKMHCQKKKAGKTPCIYIAPNHYFAPGTKIFGYIRRGPVQGVVAEVVLGPGC